MNGAPVGTAKIHLIPTSLDPKYNTSDTGVAISIVVIQNDNFATIDGIPPLAQLNEGDLFPYKIILSTIPIEDVNVHLLSNSIKCKLTKMDVTFNTNNYQQPSPEMLRGCPNAQCSVLRLSLHSV